MEPLKKLRMFVHITAESLEFTRFGSVEFLRQWGRTPFDTAVLSDYPHMPLDLAGEKNVSLSCIYQLVSYDPMMNLQALAGRLDQLGRRRDNYFESEKSMIYMNVACFMYFIS